MKGQKGQGILEFAIILPLFLLLAIGSMYFGMIFADYVALNSIASRAAREASFVEKDDYKENGYENIKQRFKNQELPADIYKWDYSKFVIEYEGERTVVVKAVITLNDKSDFAKIAGNVLESAALGKLEINYRMYTEYDLSAE